MDQEVERRKPFDGTEAKFSTQKTITLIILLLFTYTLANVMTGTDQAERSMLLQTVINLTLLGVGYWLGSSKGAAESREQLGKIADDKRQRT